ncbi:MAG: hypothetical protein AB1333_01420 [Patescibacteria group bacterium]
MEKTKEVNLQKTIANFLREVQEIPDQNAFLRFLISLLKLRKMRNTPYATGVSRIFQKLEKTFPKNMPYWKKKSFHECKSIALGTFSAYSNEEVECALSTLVSMLPSGCTEMKESIGRELKKRVSDVFDFHDQVQDEKKWIENATKDAIAMNYKSRFKIFLYQKEKDEIISSFRTAMKNYLSRRYFSNLFVANECITAERWGKKIVIIPSVEKDYLVVSVEENFVFS